MCIKQIKKRIPATNEIALEICEVFDFVQNFT